MPTPASASQVVVATPARLPGSGRRRGWALRLALAACYIGGWCAISQIHLQASDLERFYIPAALIALHGRPLFIYSAATCMAIHWRMVR